MKPYRFIFLLAAVLLLAGCTGPNWVEPQTYSAYEPVLMARPQLEQSIRALPPRDILDAGKIYLWNNLVFINERYKGVHVILNTNPQEPVNMGFIQVPGNLDVAVKQGVLFADNGVDLVAIDFSDLQQLRVTKRIKDAFPELPPPDGLALDQKYNLENRPADGIVVGWTKKSKS